MLTLKKYDNTSVDFEQLSLDKGHMVKLNLHMDAKTYLDIQRVTIIIRLVELVFTTIMLYMKSLP